MKPCLIPASIQFVPAPKDFGSAKGATCFAAVKAAFIFSANSVALRGLGNALVGF